MPADMFEPLHSWQGATTTRKEGTGSKEVCKLGVVRVRLNGISRRVRYRRKQPVQARFRTADITDVPFGICVLHSVSSPFIADVVVPKKPISRGKGINRVLREAGSTNTSVGDLETRIAKLDERIEGLVRELYGVTSYSLAIDSWLTSGT